MPKQLVAESKESVLSTRSGIAALDAENASRLGHVIKLAEQALTSVKANALREFELTVPQYSAMVALSFVPGASGAQLARICAVTPQTMATVLANLETKSLIQRSPSSVHQKVLVTKLTRSGQALVRKADAKAKAIEDRLAQEFDAAERETLAALLERAIDALTGANTDR
jgi:DNA-binding MarR family transcriptional regulator